MMANTNLLSYRLLVLSGAETFSLKLVLHGHIHNKMILDVKNWVKKNNLNTKPVGFSIGNTSSIKFAVEYLLVTLPITCIFI